ncbi:MAG: wax ester/triacylglycerol synthase family O-acyltransferase [Solirubrobacterales bacterium]|nr:wax ester/triacylglycerol synthase family O-acyltransferase [Solirubrobacterales bacterium]
MSAKPLSAADAAWLHMDRPDNPMVVNALVLLGAVPDRGRLATVIDDGIVKRFPRFSQRIHERRGRAPLFEDAPGFTVEDHIHRLALPEPGDDAALAELVGDLIGGRLDPGRPLWQAYLIEGHGDGAALLVRIHHCVADGIALARVLLSVADGGPGWVERGVPPHHGLVHRTVTASAAAGAAAVHESVETLLHPGHARALASAALRDGTTVAKLLGASADADTPLRGPLAGSRRVAWSPPFPVARVKEAGRRVRATVNDVLVAALTGALRDHLERAGEAPDELRALVPFNLRPLDEPPPPELGNDFALILLSLPVGVADRRARLLAVRERMNAIKDSHEAPISYGILTAIGRTPPAVEDRLIGFFTDKASMVVTNVPGPREPVGFAGVPVEGVLVWAPCSGGLGMTVSIFSYAGAVTAGFMTDAALVPDPGALADGFDRELHALCRGVRVPAGPQS